MNKEYSITYKVYSFENTYYSKHLITAASKHEAYIKFMAESNAISPAAAKELIEAKLGKRWLLAHAIDKFNPLGSSNLELYRVDTIRKRRTTPIKHP